MATEMYVQRENHLYTATVPLNQLDPMAGGTLQEVLVLSRYSSPSENDVVRYVVEKADEISQRRRLILPGQPMQATVLQAKLLQIDGISPSAFQEIVRRDATSPVVDRLYQVGLALKRTGQGDSEWIYGGVAYLPPEHPLGSRQSIEEALKDPHLQEKGFGIAATFHLRYEKEQERAVLPPAEELAVLLKHRVTRSQTLRVDGVPPPSSLERAAGLLYSNYARLSEIEALPVSTIALDETSLVAVDALLREFARAVEMQRQMQQRLGGGGIISPFSGKPR